MTDAERHLVHRLVAFFATGDSIVANNLVLNLYKHINAPEARMYLSRQLYEEALHLQFYLTLLDTYVPDPEERHRAFAAVENPVDHDRASVDGIVYPPLAAAARRGGQ
jgi:ribonucleoside-diphosphate reductase beta chain